MLGNIIGIEGNTVYLRLNAELTDIKNIINLYVNMKDDDIQIVGEIIEINEQVATINLIGEIVDKRFVFGVMRKPSFSSEVSLISKENIGKIIGIPNYQDHKDLYFGTSPIYPEIQVGVNINNFLVIILLFLVQQVVENLVV